MWYSDRRIKLSDEGESMSGMTTTTSEYEWVTTETGPVAVELQDTGAATQVAAREAPWTKLGKLVDKPMTAAEAAQAGGINFNVSFRPVEYTGGDGQRRTMINRMVVERDDTHEPLSVVSAAYSPLQYGEAFDFMDTIDPHYVAAGALRGGRQAFMVVKLPGQTEVDLLGTDTHEFHVVLRTSHDCTRAVEASVMPLRGLCMNMLTLNTFNQGAPRRWAITHVGDVKGKLAQAQITLTNFDAYVAAIRDVAEQLAETHVAASQAETILRKVLPDRPKRDDVIATIINKWQTSPTVGADFFTNGWGLVNAVGEYFDWTRSGGSPASRFIGALQGQSHIALNKTAAALLSATI